MKLILKSFFTIIALILVSATSFADGGPNPPPPKTPTPPGEPIDGNIIILLFFALVLGYYKIHQFKKYKKTPN